MFKHLFFRIRNYRTVKEICRICNLYEFYIDDRNREFKKFPMFSRTSGFSGTDIKIRINKLNVNVYSHTIRISLVFQDKIGTVNLFGYSVDSFRKIPEIPYEKYTPLIESTLNQILSILKEFEKEILEKKAKEEAERLADIDKILLKR